jgi:putative transposase
MPYDYRRMTPEEREAAVAQRRELGYPLHQPPHPFRDAGRYLITAANYEHASIMAEPARCTLFESRLLAAMREVAIEVYGWVVLPNHYHILIVAWCHIPRMERFGRRDR